MGSRIAALTAVFLVLFAGVAQARCAEDSVALRGEFGQVRFSVDIADTPQETARGLMFVEEMARSHGMLFVFPRESRRSFWMRNTLIPLDILFFDARGVLLNTAADAKPLDETSLYSDGPAQYVLEINGGLAAQLGIEPGAQLRHPRIGADAAWPCD